MGVKLAKTAGFCWGVKRAMDMALKVSSEEDVPVRTFGPLIHNRQAIDLLKSRQVGEIDDVDEAGEEMMVLIRAHGITPQTRDEILRRGSRVCDATCPHVIRAQKIVERQTRQGFDAIIIGDRDHAETIGIRGHAADPDGGGPGGRAFVIESVDEIDPASDAYLLPDNIEKLIVVAQTTQEAGRFDIVSKRLAERWPGAIIKNTVCSDASNRQDELKELAHEVDAIVVVGGRHSANTQRLAQIARDGGAPTWLVETAEELDVEALRSFKEIGVTAGASTPQWIITGVVERLETLQTDRLPAPARAVSALFRFAVIGHLYLASGAAALTWAASSLMGLEPRWVDCLFAGFFVLAAHLLHRRLGLPDEPSLLHGSLRYFHRHRHVYLVLCGVAGVGALTCAALIHPLIVALAAFSMISGAGYIWATRPREGERGGLARFVIRVAGSKDLLMAAAWAAVVVGQPYVSAWLQRHPPAFLEFLLLASAIFLLVVIRSVLADLRDIDDDLLVGRDTLPTAIGHKTTLRLVTLAVVMLAVAFVAALGRTHGWVSALWAAPAIGFVVLNVVLTWREHVRHGALWDALIDGQILATAGTVALAALLSGK